MADNFSSQLANAFVLLELGNFKTATDILERQMEALASAMPVINVRDVETIANLCSKLIHSRQTMELSFFQKLFSITNQCFGREHPMSLSAELQLASALLIKGHFDSAVKMAIELLDRCEHIHGKDNSLTVQCALLLLSAYAKKKDFVSGQLLIARIPAVKDALLKDFLGGQG